ncbi:MAG: Rpn family recombination-promoting nuclease/putative transposase [Opitutales bacterium]|nr:Rpn family recombination-promoting nuclease/putative transposase [Opitutales bacterium]
MSDEPGKPPEEKLLKNPHDRFFHKTFGDTKKAAPFLQRVLPAALSAEINWASLEPLPVTMVSKKLRERASDLVFRAPWKDQETLIYCLFEHQSTSDRRMPLRLLEYQLGIWESWESQKGNSGKPLPLIIPVVLFQGRGGWQAPAKLHEMIAVPKDTAESTWQVFVPDFRYQVIDLHQKESLEPFRTWQYRCILSLMASIFLSDDNARMEKAVKALGDLFHCDNDLSFLQTAIEYLFAADGEIDKETFFRHIERIEDKSLKEKTMSIAEILRTEGRQEGRQEGEETGRLKEARSVLKKQLSKRFGDLSPAQQQALDAARLEKIEFWAEEIFDAISTDDLLSR